MEESELGGDVMSQTGTSIVSGVFGLIGTVQQEEGRAPQSSAQLAAESISIFAVAERQIAHFKARVVFRLTASEIDVTDLKLVIPNSNLVVYYLQATIDDTSIYRIGFQDEPGDRLEYSFGQQRIRTDVQFIIRGSFRYLENPTVGLVTLIFPCLVGRQSGLGSVGGGHAGRRIGEDANGGRDLRLEVQCLLTLPAPCVRSVGCSPRSVSPDGCRVFLRHTDTRNIMGSVEFCLLCGTKCSDCPNILLHHPEVPVQQPIYVSFPSVMRDPVEEA